ncbi:MAG: glycoside hydrolase family 36 N-terminal domain-containing protein, partial [Paracoccus sp. (in: a-proteobacteria)]|nr:glycoside hydrolase family 36 N-terminal domain-containing protein [Paracoccus sp. (in: a-proteobacteria)]
MKLWRIDTSTQMMVLGTDGGMAACHYWGVPLPDDTDLATLVTAGMGGLTGGMLDALPPLSLIPEARRSCPGQPGLVAYQNGVTLEPEWRFKDADEGAALTLRHIAPGLQLEITAQAMAHGLIALSARLFSDTPLTLHHLALALPIPPHLSHLTELAGRWTREFQPVTTGLDHGARLRDARTGRSGHDHAPHLWLTGAGTTNTDGEAFALHYGWSGGHRMLVETLPEGRRQIQLGQCSGTERAPGTEFATAEIWLARGDQGLNSVFVPFQRTIRDRLPPARRP